MKSLQSICLFLLIITLLSCTKDNTINAQSVYIAPALPSLIDKTFSIKDFGAIGDGVKDNTKSVQDAINAATNAGGGKVVVPSSGIYLCGPIQFASNLNLVIEAGAILKMLPIDQYPGGTTDGIDFIGGSKLHDIAVTGKGTIDGQGSPWWPFAKIQNAKRPRMIAFSNCDKVLIDQVKLVNSPMFHIAVSKSSNITVQGVTISAPASTDPVNPSHNTDACDVSGQKILIQNCNVSVGDDNFTCGGGTSDVHITNCTYGDGHGVSIGSYTNGGVSNITVDNCTFTNTDTGIRIKSDRDRGGLVQNITYKNLTMTNVGIPILIYAAYTATDSKYRDLQKLTPAIAATYPSATVTDHTPVYQNITFQDITATTASGKRAGLIWGLPEANVSTIIMKNVNIVADNPFGIFFANGVQLVNCKIKTQGGENNLALTNADVTIDGIAAK